MRSACTASAHAGSVRPATRLLAGLIGAGIGHSLSPALHEQEARALGLRLQYELLDTGRDTSTAALARRVDAMRAAGFAGMNITYPFKQAVIPLLDQVSPAAEAVGAVNTVVCRDGRLIGYNTDGSGWAQAFARMLPRASLGCVLLLGAGGAGSALALALLDMGVQRLRLLDEDPARAARLRDRLATAGGRGRVELPADLDQGLEGTTGIINATPVGMHGAPGSPLGNRRLRADQWVSDIVYAPLETELLRAARAAGCATMDGTHMLVGQAAGAFERFTGVPPDLERMARHCRGLLLLQGHGAASGVEIG